MTLQWDAGTTEQRCVVSEIDSKTAYLGPWRTVPAACIQRFLGNFQLPVQAEAQLVYFIFYFLASYLCCLSNALLVTCGMWTWQYHSVPLQVYTRYGKCYTFNGNKTTSKKTKQGGMGNGLEIMLDIQQDEYLPIWRETSKAQNLTYN